MILKDCLEETRNKEGFPGALILLDRFIEAASFIPDECFRLGRMVEIGAYQGGTTLRLAYLAKKYNLSPVVAVDIWEPNNSGQSLLENPNKINIFDIFLENFKNNNLLEYVEYYKEDSKELGKRWDQFIGFIIFDGSHYYEDVKKDMLLWEKKIVPGGIIIVDDFGPWGDTLGPEGAAKEVFLSNSNYEIIYKNNTFLVLRKKA